MINLYKDSGKLIYLLSSNMSRKKVVSASKAFVKSKKHCIVLTLSDDKSSLEGFGDESWVEALRETPELYEKLTEVLVAAAGDVLPGTSLSHESFPKKLPKLFAPPGSKQWKGLKIRTQLSKYLEFFGFGHNMAKRYGDGSPPPGWPVLVHWNSFKGPSRGCSMMLATEIIKQLLEAQDLDPMEHFIKEDEKEDGDTEEEQQPQEQDAGVPQLEEEQEPEEQEPGPSRKRKGKER